MNDVDIFNSNCASQALRLSAHLPPNAAAAVVYDAYQSNYNDNFMSEYSRANSNGINPCPPHQRKAPRSGNTAEKLWSGLSCVALRRWGGTQMSPPEGTPAQQQHSDRAS